MAKFTLYPPGNPDDPFGGNPVIVDIPERSSAPGAFRLAENSFLPETPLPVETPRPFFDDDAPLSPEMRFSKINLGPARSEDQFAGLGDSAPSPLARFGKFSLAPQNGDGYFDLPRSNPGDEPEAGFTKNATGGFQKFSQFAKLEDTEQGPMVWGVATHEEPDLDNEICSYDDAVDAYKEWSHAAYKRTADAGQEPSLGNVRLQHGTEIGGKAVKIEYDDAGKRILVGSVPFNDQVLSDIRKGYYTGYSQGGSYAWRKCADCGNSLPLQQANNFCSNCKKSVPVKFGLKRLSEISYVDSPCTGEGFQYVKADGTTGFVNFAKRTASAAANGVEVLDAVRIFGNVWKHAIRIGNRKRTVVLRGDDIVLVA